MGTIVLGLFQLTFGLRNRTLSKLRKIHMHNCRDSSVRVMRHSKKQFTAFFASSKFDCGNQTPMTCDTKVLLQAFEIFT